jgi:hypothetical protein
MSTTYSKKQLLAFLRRRHPEYSEVAANAQFLQATYAGGREWFENNIHKYLKEGDSEHKNRKERAYRFNHTREVVDLVDKHLFKLEISRSADAPQALQDFWASATMTGLSMKDFAKAISKNSSINGRHFVVIDSTSVSGVVSKADAKKAKVRTYGYIVLPQFVLDVGYSDVGEMEWILIQENIRDDVNPILSNGAINVQYRLWTKEFSQLFLVEGKLDATDEKSIKITPQKPVNHNLGIVPVVACDNVISEEPYTSPALIADVAYMDRAVANYLSNMDAIIQDQTFSQLCIPAQGLLPGAGDDGGKLEKLVEMGTKRIFTYNGEGGAKPEYLSPDVKQAELILKIINKIISEIYHSVGLAGERTKEDNGGGVDNSSGVAKAYDFERVNSLLASKADSLERVENQIAKIVLLRNGEKVDKDESNKYVTYPDNFDVRGLYDEFEIAARLSLIDAPDSVRRQQMETMIDKLFPQLKAELKEKMLAELKSWPPEDPLMGAAAPNGNSGSSEIKKEGKNSLANKLVKP